MNNIPTEKVVVVLPHDIYEQLVQDQVRLNILRKSRVQYLRRFGSSNDPSDEDLIMGGPELEAHFAKKSAQETQET